MERRAVRIDLRYIIAALLPWGAILTACVSPPSTSQAALGIALTHTAGAAQLTRDTSTSDLTRNALLLPGDQLSTTSDNTATLQLPEGSILQLGPASRLELATIRPDDGVAVFHMLDGSVDGRVRSSTVEVRGYHEMAKNFRIVVNDLNMTLRSPTGAYRLWLKGDELRAVIEEGEFDVRVGNQQTTLPAGWQIIAQPEQPLKLVSMITPTAPPATTTAAPTATLIPIMRLTNTPTPTRTPTSTPSATATATPAPTRTQVRQTVTASTPAAAPITDTPQPTATEKPGKPPPRPTAPPTQPPPTAPPPTQPPPPTEPPPTEPPPTEPPPTIRPTVGA